MREIPLYENQEGYWRDRELVERIWKMKPDIESPETFSEPQTPAMVHDTIACTPENKPENKLENKPDDVSSSGSLAIRPVSKCFEPNKRRIDLNFEN